MQGTYGCTHSKLLQALKNAADESLRLAHWVKINVLPRGKLRGIKPGRFRNLQRTYLVSMLS